MAARFLRKTSLAAMLPLQLGNKPVIADYARLRRLLTENGAGADGDLFAEPIVTSPTALSEGSISWYTDLSGDVAFLADLPSDRRARVVASLQSALGALRPLLVAPELGPLLHKALFLPDIDGVVSVGGRAVLSGWGLAATAADLTVDPAVLLGRTALTQLAALGPPTPQSPPRTMPAPPAAPPPAIAVVAPPPANARARSPFLPVAILAAILCLALGTWLGGRLVATQRISPGAASLFDAAAARAALDALQQKNSALQQEIAARRAALGGNICQPGSAQAPPSPPPAAQHSDLPQSGWQDHDVSILQGCWDLDGHEGSVDHDDNGNVLGKHTIAERRLCFDRTGHAHQTITRDDDKGCSNDLVASFDQSDKVILRELGRCTGTSNFDPMEITCTRESDENARCISKDLRMAITPGEAKFHRAP